MAIANTCTPLRPALGIFADASPRGVVLSAAVAGVVLLSTLVVYFLGPPMFEVLQADSQGYLGFASARSAFYPMFLDALQGIGLGPVEITQIQFWLYLMTLFALIFGLAKHGWPLWVVGPFGAALSLNAFFVRHHGTILTESLIFSLQNILLLCLALFPIRRSAWLLGLAALCVGVSIGVRPAAASQAVALVLVVCLWSWGDARGLLRRLMLVVAIMAALVGVEAALYHSRHDVRQSLLPLHLYGKLAMLTLEEGFAVEGLPPAADQLVLETERAFEPIQDWFAAVDNVFVETTRAADFEVFAQYSLLRERLSTLASAGHLSVAALKETAGWAALQQNPGGYLRLTATHYLGLWSVQALGFFGMLNSPSMAVTLPFDPSSWGAFSDPMPSLSLVVFPAFLGLGAVLFGLMVFGLLRLPVDLAHWRRPRLAPELLLAVSLTVFVQGHLVGTALFGVSTPRYLMASYAAAVLAALLVAAWGVRRVRRRLHEKPEASSLRS